jgi:hypothetical protein
MVDYFLSAKDKECGRDFCRHPKNGDGKGNGHYSYGRRGCKSLLCHCPEYIEQGAAK